MVNNDGTFILGVHTNNVSCILLQKCSDSFLYLFKGFDIHFCAVLGCWVHMEQDNVLTYTQADPGAESWPCPTQLDALIWYSLDNVLCLVLAPNDAGATGRGGQASP